MRGARLAATGRTDSWPRTGLSCWTSAWLKRLGRASARPKCSAGTPITAFTPRNPVTYATYVLLYQFGSGIAYGTFTGFVLSVIGKGAVATKYTLMAALSNIPIAYMKYINGWAANEHGLINMLYVDAASEIVGIAALLLILVALRPGADEKSG